MYSSANAIVKRGGVSEQVEIIPIVSEGHKKAFLRFRRMPKFAFLIWDGRTDGTRGKICFRKPDGSSGSGIHVLCACCCVYVQGLTPPSDEKRKEEWAAVRKQRFKDAVVSTALDAGIDTIFMRKGDYWNGVFGGEVEGLSFAPVLKHREVMTAKYRRVTMIDTLSIVTYRGSDLL